MSFRITIIPILGHEPREIPAGLRIGSFWVFSALTCPQTRHAGLGRRYRDRGGRRLDLEICRIQLLVVIVDGVNVNLIPFGVCLELELREPRLLELCKKKAFLYAILYYFLYPEVEGIQLQGASLR